MFRSLFAASLCAVTLQVARANDVTGGDASPSKAIEANADPIARDQAAIQGCWVRHFANEHGVKFRVEKVVNGNFDTVSEFDPRENLLHSHRSAFQLSRDGDTGVFTISNTEVIAGQQLGARRAGPRLFLYRIAGDSLYEVWGLRDSDAVPLRVFVWTRKK